MKLKMTTLIAATLLAACSQQPNSGNETSAESAEQAKMSGVEKEQVATDAKQASATGTVQAVDPDAGTSTIAHGPVDALQWPAMTMTFMVPGVDLSSIKQGDRVTFEFTSKGMDGTISKIAHQQ